jgi:hypothetical protein
MPGCAFTDVVLFDHHDVGEAQPGQVVRDAAAGDTSADDDHRGLRTHSGVLALNWSYQKTRTAPSISTVAED